jgi:CheY-like chemotaxis protein
MNCGSRHGCYCELQFHSDAIGICSFGFKLVNVDAPPSPAVKTVLLVDDRDDSRITAKWFLSNFGFAVDSARSGEEALALFDPKIHDVVITDNSMDGMSGLEMAHIIKLRSPTTPIIMHTGDLPEDRSCLDLVIQRPTHLLALKEAVEQALAAKRP